MAAPASGKSYGAIRYIVHQIKSNSKKYVIAAISVDLCKELYKDMLAVDDTLKVELIITDNTERSRRVQDKYEEYLQEDNDVIIITHSTLKNFNGREEAEGWSMVVDELPNILEMKAVRGTLQNDNISQWLDFKHPDKEESYREMVVKTGWERTLENELAACEDISNEDNFLSGNALDGLHGLLSGESTIIRHEFIEESTGLTKVNYFFSNIHNPYILWNGFEEVIFLCAEFDEQLTGLLFKHKFNIEVTEKEEIQLRSTEYKQPHRIKIYPLLKPPMKFTRGVSTSYYDKKTGYKFQAEISGNLKEMFQHLIDVAEEIVGDDGYIYTVNKMRSEQVEEGDFGFLAEKDRVKRLKYNPHGLNSFMDYNIALGLFHCNPAPYQVTLLRHIAETCGVEKEVFLKGYETTAYLDPIFQLVTRTKVRNFNDLEEIVCIVPDERVVEYLTNGWFKGATVDYRYAVEVHHKTRENTRPKKFQGLLDMNSAEKKAYQRWVKNDLGISTKQMDISNKEHAQLVTEWLENKRNK